MLIFWLGSRPCASSSCSSPLLESRLVGWMVRRLRLFQFHFVYDMFWLYLIYGIALYTKLVPWRLRGVTKMSVPQTARQSVLEQSCWICSSTATIHCLWGGKNKLHEPRNMWATEWMNWTRIYVDRSTYTWGRSWSCSGIQLKVTNVQYSNTTKGVPEAGGGGGESRKKRW